MDKEEPNFNVWLEISVSELVLEAAKVEQKYEKQQEKRGFARLEEDDLQQLVKNKCYRTKTNGPQFSMVYTLIDHRNDAIKMVKTLQWNHSPAAGGSTWVLNIYDVISMVYKRPWKLVVHLLVTLLNARYISYDLEGRLSVALFKAHHISMEGIRNGYLFCQKLFIKG